MIYIFSVFFPIISIASGLWIGYATFKYIKSAFYRN